MRENFKVLPGGERGTTMPKKQWLIDAQISPFDVAIELSKDFLKEIEGFASDQEGDYVRIDFKEKMVTVFYEDETPSARRTFDYFLD